MTGHALLLRARRSEFRFPTEAPRYPTVSQSIWREGSVVSDYFTNRIDRERQTRNHVRQLQALGYQVTLSDAA